MNTHIFDCNNNTIQAEQIVKPFNKDECKQSFSDASSCEQAMLASWFDLTSYSAGDTDGCKSESKVGHTGTLYTKKGSPSLCVATDKDGDAILLSFYDQNGGSETDYVKTWAKGDDVPNEAYRKCTPSA